MRFDSTGTAAPTLTHRYLDGPTGQAIVDEVFDAAGQSTEVLWLLADHEGTIRDMVADTGILRKHTSYSGFGSVSTTGEEYLAATACPAITPNITAKTTAE